MMPTDSLRSHLDMLLISALSGCAYCVIHLFNGWALRGLEFSAHISLIYLPGFLRLVNVLVLGLFWGTLGTVLGGLMLLFWLQEPLSLGLSNIAMSAGSALVAVLLMRLLLGRKVVLAHLWDLLRLALLYALLNALLHHVLLSWLDPSQLVAPEQLIYMVVGDINGAIIGALLLRWVARRMSLIDKLRSRSDNDGWPPSA